MGAQRQTRTHAEVAADAAADTVVRIMASRRLPSTIRSEDLALLAGVPHADLVAAVARFKARVAPKPPARPRLTVVRDRIQTQNRRPREPKPGEKWCGRCGEFHPVSAFGVRAAAPDGLQAWCRPAMAQASKDAHRRKRDRELGRSTL